jgi:hypothetical protein
MKFIKFNFSHPFKGRASLIQLNTKVPNSQSIMVDSEGLLEIPIDGCQKGKWQLILDWQYDNRLFCYHQNFEV